MQHGVDQETIPADRTALQARAFLSLGSNQGDRLEALRAALRALDHHPQIKVAWNDGVAAVYETAPVQVSDSQPLYLNTAVLIRTSLHPKALLEETQSIERRLGRVRDQRRGARTIDIDLLLYDDLVIREDNLTIPHPHMHERRFVLEPLREIAPQLIHPELGISIAALAAALPDELRCDSACRWASPEALRSTGASDDLRPPAPQEPITGSASRPPVLDPERVRG